MDDKRMFAQLMEKQPPDAPEPKSKVIPVVPAVRPERSTTPNTDSPLPHELEDLSEVGYTSHSYRLTETELRWLRRFCMRMSERMDKTVSHNTLIRLLFRVVDQEWTHNPEDNRLLDLLSKLKN